MILSRHTPDCNEFECIESVQDAYEKCGDYLKEMNRREELRVEPPIMDPLVMAHQ